MSNWDAVCDGCSACAMRCTDGINISEFEFTRIVDELRGLDAQLVRRVLHQEKERQWDETTYLACLFLDVSTHRCLVYPARPLICRLFGRVAHLPCPAGKIPADLDADRIIAAYAEQPLQPFQEWMIQFGYLSFGDLLGGDAGKDYIEL